MSLLELALIGSTCCCGGTVGVPEEEALKTTDAEIRSSIGPKSLSFEYFHPDSPFPAGVAVGKKAVFVGSPLEGRVLAYSRYLGTPLGELPQPPGGFVLPFMMKHIGPNRVAIMDAGGFPSPLPLIPTSPTIHEYEYSVTATGFSATLSRSVSFGSRQIGFAEDIVLLEDGRYLLADTVLGGIWIAGSDGTITPGIVPKTTVAEDAIPELAFCSTMPLVEVGGVPFLFTGSTIPGISTIAERNGTVYFASSCAGGVYKFPLSVLSDEREPWERASSIELLSAQPAETEIEELLSMVFNPERPNEPYAYVADALEFRITRVNINTGARQVVADDFQLFNFPSSLAFMPPLRSNEIAPQLVVVSNQQHLTTLTNDAIPEDRLTPPFIATRMLLKP